MRTCGALGHAHLELCQNRFRHASTRKIRGGQLESRKNAARGDFRSPRHPETLSWHPDLREIAGRRSTKN